MAITTSAFGGSPRKCCTFHPLRTHRWSTPPLWTVMEHPALSLALKIRARSPGTTRNGPESWSFKTASTDMTSLKTDTMCNTIEMKTPIAAERPNGGHLKDLRSCLATWSALSSTNGWPKQLPCSATISKLSYVSHPENYLMLTMTLLASSSLRSGPPHGLWKWTPHSSTPTGQWGNTSLSDVWQLSPSAWRMQFGVDELGTNIMWDFNLQR